MKQLFIASLLLLSVSSLVACNDADTDGKTAIVQDSLVNVLPTWQALKISVENNKTEMKVVVGDATFYNASPEEKKRKADDLARMILRIYGPGNYLEKGTLIVTRDVKNNSWDPSDGVATPLDFKAFKARK